MIRYQITDGTVPPSATADFIQFRNSDLSARELSLAVRQLLAMALSAPILVNDRLDVALAVGAAGVHLRSHAIPPSEVRKLTPPGFLITVACHSEADIEQAGGADYALLSPIFSPLSKADDRVPLGLAELARLAAKSTVPILALGGITEGNVSLCMRHGAAGVAGISFFARV